MKEHLRSLDGENVDLPTAVLLSITLRWFAYYDDSPTAISTSVILPTKLGKVRLAIIRRTGSRLIVILKTAVGKASGRQMAVGKMTVVKASGRRIEMASFR